MKIRLLRAVFAVAFVLCLGWIGWRVYAKLQEGGERRARGPRAATAVAAAPIERGAIELRRSFSGTLEARASFDVSPKVSGLVEALEVELADRVKRGQIIARLDSAEFAQAELQAKAELAVSEARRVAALSVLALTDRELERSEALFGRGLITDIELQKAKAEQLAARAGVEVAKAEVKRSQAALSMASIRLGYTEVAASWAEGDDERVVARRHVNAGDSVTTSSPLVSIVQLKPIVGVIFVTERDYARVEVGQPVTLSTGAYPGEVFRGEVRRIAPVFQRSTRQARVEVEVANEDLRLKPGMFIRAEVVLERREDAAIVPELALCRRGDEDGVFVLSADGRRAAWRPVRIGIREGARVQVIGEGLSGRVVTLGQQLIEDGSAVSVALAAGAGGDR